LSALFHSAWAGKSQFAADGIGDALEIGSAPVAERTRLSGYSGKPEDPQYIEIAQARPTALFLY
jgi:hypothetical protein